MFNPICLQPPFGCIQVRTGSAGQSILIRKDIMVRTHSKVLVIVTAVSIALGCAASAMAQERRVIKMPGTEGFPFSDGIVVGNTLYIAGQQGTNDKGKLPPGGITPETDAALHNIEQVVKAAGFEMKDIVVVNVYLADIKEFPDMNKVYKSIMPEPKPTRTTVQVSGLANNARVEISAMAVKEK